MTTQALFSVLLVASMVAYALLSKRVFAKKQRLREFLLADQTVGIRRSGHNSFGIGFSFANGFWFCVVLGFAFGWIGMLIQLIWSASIALYGLFLARRVAKALHSGGTIHSLIGARFGTSAQILATIATTIGYILNYGFETYFGSFIVASALGSPHLALYLAIAVATATALYCYRGGYEANVRTDRIQNYLGVFAAVACVAIFWANTDVDAGSLSYASWPDTNMMIGLCVFLFTFNLVDMANWQISASNARLDEDTLRQLPRSFYTSAVGQMLLPSLGGVILGILLRGTGQALTDDQLLPTAFSIIETEMGLVLAPILVGLLACTFSTGDSYLMAAAHTLSRDLLARKSTKTYLEASYEDNALPSPGEAGVVEHIKIALFPLAVGSTVLFYVALSSIGRENVFSLQFIMYGSALCLLPAALSALNQFGDPVEEGSFAGVFSIAAGLFATLLVFAGGAAGWTVYGLIDTNLAPAIGLVVAAVAFLVSKWMKL